MGYGIIRKNMKGRTEMAGKKWTAAACILWIAGLASFIIGLNMTGSTREWMILAGSITFLAGLGIIGAIRLRRKDDE